MIAEHEGAAFRRLTVDQWAWLVLLIGLSATIVLFGAAPWFAAGIYLTMAMWRLLLVMISRRGQPDAVAPASLPSYTVIVALYREADLVPQIVERLSALDYPRDRLSGLILLEEDDKATLKAAASCLMPEWLRVLIVPCGRPQTKPRALSYALQFIHSDLVTVYDAEDWPDSRQLSAAAGRFAQDRSGRLACLQAPLRIDVRRAARPSAFLDQQFAAEYAALFEVTLPGMANLGLPFPLGGTSNHFRTEALKDVGGWDPFNVTEDADLGFRLWRRGWTLNVFDVATSETPPGSLSRWAPQRARWLKGYMQTLGVHTRRIWWLGRRGSFSLAMTLGAGIVSAAIHAASLLWLAWTAVAALALHDVQAALTLPFALCVFGMGTFAAWLTCAVGARRAGVEYGLIHMLFAPAYWCLSSFAFALAVGRLIRDPFHWDKTPHEPDAVLPLDETASVPLSADHVPSPQPAA